MKKLRATCCLILLACSFIAHPQGHQLHFDHLGTADGLSHGNVFSILQDSRGFMWFGTWEGLNKYDGYKIKVYKNDPLDKNSISSNFITNIVECKNGDLWIATEGGGINRYDRSKDCFTGYRHDARNSNSISSDIVNDMMKDKQGNLWIGTDAGLDLFDPVKNKFEHFVHKPNDPGSLVNSEIKYVFEDTQGQVWVGTFGGINLFHPQSNSFTHLQHHANDSKSLGSDNVTTMFEDSKHRLWIGTEGAGIELYDQKSGLFRHFRHDENNPNSLSDNVISCIKEDTENNLWIATGNGGLSIFNYNTGIFTTCKNDRFDRSSIGYNSINTIYRDSKNNMWIGNFSGGIDLVNKDKLQFAHFNNLMSDNSLADNQVLSMFEDSKKNIWIGTDGGGLDLFDPRNARFTHFRHKKNNDQSICGDHVLTACEDSKGNIWTGTWATGVTVYSPASNTYKHFKNNPADASSLSNNNAWTIYEDRQKNIWIGTSGGGLNLLNPDGKSFTRYQFDPNRDDGISCNYIVSFFEDSDDDFWICTNGGGLNLFNRRTKTFSRFLHDDEKNSISNNSLSSICEGSNKELWIGTRSGLNRFNKKTGRFNVYTMANGLPNSGIFGILRDGKNNLWISTNEGIACFNPATGVFKNYDESDGLQSDEFKVQAFCKTASGMMYFGGINGFNQFFPDSIHAIAYEPSLVITNFQVFNKKLAIAKNADDPSPLKKDITETKTITLPYSSAEFSLEFASLNYTSPEKKRYKYMLAGFDKDWNETGTAHIATYTNLDPGKYLFKVKGLNNEGGWSTNVTTMEIIITPPFWLTWWFKMTLILAFAGMLAIIYNFRVHTIKSQKRKLQQQVREQTRQLLMAAGEESKARKEAEKAHTEAEFANKELKMKNKELEQFAYVASHDLQEPLRTTSGFVQLLKQQYQGKLDAKGDKYLNFISDASDRMKVLIKDLLDFSRIGVNVELKTIDCNTIVKNMLSDILVAVQESGAVVQYTHLPVIVGYPSEIKMLFQNLVLNAIKFCRKDVTPRINISAKQSGAYWEFAVSDNGIGIEEKDSERIFDIFQRLHTRKEYAGSGIGLSHCKKIVELHKGRIWLESELGKEQLFSLPFYKGNENEYIFRHRHFNLFRICGQLSSREGLYPGSFMGIFHFAEPEKYAVCL